MARKPKKRLQKKQQTRKQKEILSAKYSPKEQKRLGSEPRQKEAKRIARNEKRKADRAESKKFLQDQGLDLKFINRHKLSNKLSKSYDSRTLLKLKKQNILENAGIPYTQKDLSTGWVKLQEKYPNIIIPENAWKHPAKEPKKPPFNPNVRLTGDKWLYVGYADIDDFMIEDLTNVSDDDLIELINDMIDYAADTPDDSSGFRGVFKTATGTEKEVKHAAAVYYNRDYSMDPKHIKFTTDRYNKISISNRFSQREFHEMIFTCISQMRSEHVSTFINDMRDYCKQNSFPFMKDIHSIGRIKRKK